MSRQRVYPQNIKFNMRAHEKLILVYDPAPEPEELAGAFRIVDSRYSAALYVTDTLISGSFGTGPLMDPTHNGKPKSDNDNETGFKGVILTDDEGNPLGGMK